MAPLHVSSSPPVMDMAGVAGDHGAAQVEDVGERQAGVCPHARRGHRRVVGGREVLVRPTVVHASRAPALSALVHRISYIEAQEAAAKLADPRQQDLFVVLRREIERERLRDMEQAGCIAMEGVSGYARLDLDEAERLAMARLGSEIEELALRALSDLDLGGGLHGAQARVASSALHLQRVEQECLQASMARLDPRMAVLVACALQQGLGQG